MDSETVALWITTVAAVASLAIQAKAAWQEKHNEPEDDEGTPDGEPFAPEEDQG